MVELIRQLLLKHNCVVIPNFGAFIGNYNPAEIRLMENKILPPSKIIAFNRSLQKNDGLMMNAVAHHFSISYHDAEIKVNEFSKQCNDSILLNRSLILNGIGRLLFDQENNIQFHPQLSGNLLPDSFGLPEMSLHPVQRLKDSEAVIKETYQRILHPELLADAVIPRRSSSKASYWLTAVIAILFLSASLTWNIQKKNVHQSESSMFPAIENKEKAVSLVTDPVIVPATVSEPADNAAIEVSPVKPVEAAALPVENNTYIVIGAFFNEIHAGKLKTEAESKGYTVNVYKDESYGIYRTTVVVVNEEMESVLVKVKSDLNQRAWVLCVNCSL